MAGDIGDFDDYGTEIAETDDSRYSTHFHVSKKYLGLINGTKGHTKNRIEQETKAELKLPGHSDDGDITILGPTAASVKDAKRQIDMIVVSSRMKQRATHFHSIPMNKPDIMENFTRFKEAVLRDCPARGLEESVFIKPSKVHVTMGVMCLTDNEEKLLASNVLTDAKEKIIMPLLQGHLPLKIRIKGLSYMNNDSKNIHVLYAKVEEFESKAGILQELADGIVDYFNKKGLMRKEEFGRDSVNLHVTLLNTKYKNKSSQDVRAFKKKRIPFDGSGILEKFGDFEFGVLEVSEIHLSQLGAIGADGLVPLSPKSISDDGIHEELKELLKNSRETYSDFSIFGNKPSVCIQKVAFGEMELGQKTTDGHPKTGGGKIWQSTELKSVKTLFLK